MPLFNIAYSAESSTTSDLYIQIEGQRNAICPCPPAPHEDRKNKAIRKCEVHFQESILLHPPISGWIIELN